MTGGNIEIEIPSRTIQAQTPQTSTQVQAQGQTATQTQTGTQAQGQTATQTQTGAQAQSGNTSSVGVQTQSPSGGQVFSSISSLPSTSTDNGSVPLAGIGSLLMAVGAFLLYRRPRSHTR